MGALGVFDPDLYANGDPWCSGLPLDRFADIRVGPDAESIHQRVKIDLDPRFRQHPDMGGAEQVLRIELADFAGRAEPAEGCRQRAGGYRRSDLDKQRVDDFVDPAG